MKLTQIPTPVIGNLLIADNLKDGTDVLVKIVYQSRRFMFNASVFGLKGAPGCRSQAEI